MTMLLEQPAPSAPPGLRLVLVAPDLWRVVDRAGRALGHLESHREAAGVRYRARRYHPPTATLRLLGDFWTATEALDCLRHSR